MQIKANRLAPVLFSLVAILLLPLMFLDSAAASEFHGSRPTPTPPASPDPDGPCEEGSTPGLYISAWNYGVENGIWLHARISTDRNGIPSGMVQFFDGEHRLVDYDIHRVFLRGDHDEHPGESTDHSGDHDAEEGQGVGIRGLATLDDNERVRFQIDLWEMRGGEENVARIRWRPYVADEQHGGGPRSCPGGHNWNSTGWITIQHVGIREVGREAR